ncbi:hypothetical protein [Paraburkholderia fungorum]|jgi:hypothetical protein|uniref:Uncharacterized protein n=1 Tax=Paraburkholderia fungorum TaxID=134537 RepID=A0AAP1KTY9_9BURK|nr:hypothetical protein [Paraburkholderia fungorum]MBB4512609.1 hypothetical protein [Paraburkholderia fungorum]MBB6200515.1 hypothetical protein [Paraburkholderia fungorum]MDT8836749.1 hypothetical protein [Paraburkholderia fungorum]
MGKPRREGRDLRIGIREARARQSSRVGELMHREKSSVLARAQTSVARFLHRPLPPETIPLDGLYVERAMNSNGLLSKDAKEARFSKFPGNLIEQGHRHVENRLIYLFQ